MVCGGEASLFQIHAYDYDDGDGDFIEDVFSLFCRRQVEGVLQLGNVTARSALSAVVALTVAIEDLHETFHTVDAFEPVLEKATAVSVDDKVLDTARSALTAVEVNVPVHSRRPKVLTSRARTNFRAL